MAVSYQRLDQTISSVLVTPVTPVLVLGAFRVINDELIVFYMSGPVVVPHGLPYESVAFAQDERAVKPWQSSWVHHALKILHQDWVFESVAGTPFISVSGEMTCGICWIFVEPDISHFKILRAWKSTPWQSRNQMKVKVMPQSPSANPINLANIMKAKIYIHVVRIIIATLIDGKFIMWTPNYHTLITITWKSKIVLNQNDIHTKFVLVCLPLHL